MNEETLFAEALAITSEEERRRFMDAACGDNRDLRKAVERLLDLAQGAGSFLEHSPLEAVTDLAAGSDATSLVGDVPADDTDAGESGPTVTRQHPTASDGDISLSYLRPATRQDSLGRLGHYEVLNIVGKGSFGTVLRAFDTKLERIVAVKVLALELASMSPARKRFLREARTSAQVRHDNVVAIYSVEEEPLPYLVMEYIPGKTLQQQLDEHGPLDVPSVLRLGKQIADGLAAAHAQGLIHRDIKPGNILLDGGMEERIKITDFGLARTVDDASMTQSGMIAGTPLYMAPEQALGQKLDQRADLFSFGSVLYQMLSGRPPFRASTTVAVLKRVVEDNPRPIQEVIPEVPDWMSSVVDHLLAKDPDQRYRSARDVSDLLERCATELQAGRVPTIPRPSAASPSEVLGVPCDDSAAVRQRDSEMHRGRPLLKIAVVLAILAAVLGATEATGVTRVAWTVIRLATGSGTLVIETDDPNLKIAIDGEELTLTGGGVGELTLRPGQYQLAASKNGQPVKQELVSITRNGRTVVRIQFESAAQSDRAESANVGSGWYGWPADAPSPAIAPFAASQAKKHQEEWAQYLHLPVEYENSLGMKFRLIPPGEFLMGSTAEELQEILATHDERRWREIYLSSGPQHRVVITQPYYLGLHEVTQKQYQQVVGKNPSSFATGGQNYEQVVGLDTENFPVEQVSWNDAAAFCSRLSEIESLRPFDFQQLEHFDPSASTGYRLPTEAEWEAACRAGTTTLYWTGDYPESLLDADWIDANSNQHPHDVGKLRANPYGLCDIQGNIQEMVLDQWYPDYYAQFRTKTAVDPTGPTIGRGRVTRGGRYAAPAVVSRCSKRGVFGQDQVAPIIGFRVALPVDAVKASGGCQSPVSSATVGDP